MEPELTTFRENGFQEVFIDMVMIKGGRKSGSAENIL
jgi:hypothetical protein